MINDQELDLLRLLVSAPGIAGREHPVRQILQAALPHSDCEIKNDLVGNLVVNIPGKGERVVIVAHMDEVGLMVRRITPDGFLLVERIGGMHIRALPGSRLTLWTQQGNLPAQVGLLPQHQDHRNFIDLQEMYVDVGASFDDQVKGMGIEVGDILTWDADLKVMPFERISGKALDDRLGCLCLVLLAHQLIARNETLSCDLHLAFVVQEETSPSGSLTTTNQLQPDRIIGLDGTLAFDTPDLKNAQCDLRLGKGPAIKWMDVIRGTGRSFFPDLQLSRKIQEIAQKNNIPLQNEVVSGITTAANGLPFTHHGIPTAALSIPIRYHHSPIETADWQDVQTTIQLLKMIVTSS